MKIINTGDRYEIYSDSLLVHDSLPAQTYKVCFSRFTGFYLEKQVDLEVNEEKIYGNHDVKLKKVLRTFDSFERNLGIILSGQKGIGKSLFARLLSEEVIKNGYPFILIDEYIPGIADFLKSIEQEVVVLFDEFDKTFGDIKPADGDPDPQSTMLSLFDGLSNGKKMFIITCNNLNKLNDFLVNRPGRFHYHFRFEYPNQKEVKEYLEDKVENQYWGEIDKVISFSKKVDLNYDCLRAIAFELNCGETFENAISDLNILNVEKENYTAFLMTDDGKMFKNNSCWIDLFGDESIRIEVYYDSMEILVEFEPKDIIVSNQGQLIVEKGKYTIDYQDGYNCEDEVKRLKAMNFDYITLNKKRMKNVNFAL